MKITNVVEAVALLRDDNLVWSADLQDIKHNLADLLITAAAQGDIMLAVADTLAKKIITTEQTHYELADYKPEIERR